MAGPGSARVTITPDLSDFAAAVRRGVASALRELAAELEALPSADLPKREFVAPDWEAELADPVPRLDADGLPTEDGDYHDTAGDSWVRRGGMWRCPRYPSLPAADYTPMTRKDPR